MRALRVYRATPRPRESFYRSKHLDRAGKCNRRNRFHSIRLTVEDGVRYRSLKIQEWSWFLDFSRYDEYPSRNFDPLSASMSN